MRMLACPFFNDKMANMPTIAEMMKQDICKGDFSKCARYMVFKALVSEKVPEDLIPKQVDWVEEIIARAK